VDGLGEGDAGGAGWGEGPQGRRWPPGAGLRVRGGGESSLRSRESPRGVVYEPQSLVVHRGVNKRHRGFGTRLS
jgi:hypothetical protein